MTQISVKEFLNCTLRSGLASEEQLRAELSELKATGSHALRDAQEVADHLIASRVITAWQADKLLKGRYRGFNLGNYRLLDQLGRGGMSMVYVGEHQRMRRKVAIKVLPKSRVKNKAYLERFLVEARAAAALSHPNIVRAYDFDSVGDTHFLVMECLKGQTLSQLVQDAHPLPISDVVSYLSQAATGLQYAHAEGLVHRDIKPANLMISTDGELKVLDMGLARLAKSAEDPAQAKGEGGGMMGTADYLPPEQALNSDDVDQRADVYSLGCTLYFALTGQPPFPTGTIADKIASHQAQEPEALHNLRADCPNALVTLCQTMMAKDPDQRIGSMAEVVERLAKVEIFGLPETKVDPVARFPEVMDGNQRETPPIENHVPQSAASPPLTALSRDRTVTTRRPRQLKRSLPIWIWLVMLALILAAIWLAAKISQQGGIAL